MSHIKVKQYIQDLRNHEIDGIICVDMLGEGFDFPNLKIAAIHAPHKSLSNTLQFIGRFARTSAPKIGRAKFIAAEDETLEIENNRLYSKDAVWQEMIINMSEGKNQKEQSDREYYKDYDHPSLGDEADPISLSAITLNCHDRIYRATGFNIDADFPQEFNIENRVYRSRNDNTVIGIGLEHLSPLWTNTEHKINKIYTLYIVHYQNELKLLHIYSQKHTEKVYDQLAGTFCVNYEKIPKSKMHRVLGNLSGFEIYNSGLLNRYGESGEAYRIMAGSDIGNSIDPSTGKMYSAGHVFCKATDSSNGLAEGITIDKMNERNKKKHCIPIRGTFSECIKTLRETPKLPTAYIVIVQPSLSRQSVEMPDKIQEVLASASTYIKRAGKVKGLEIIGSE